jgi:hypothetical protein
MWHDGDVSTRRELPPTIPPRIVVVADCGCGESMQNVAELCHAHGVVPLVYDKCGFCYAVPDGVFCRPLRNVGRDLGTFLWFASRYYHAIPDSTVVFFTAGNMKKHNRAERLSALFGGRATPARNLGEFESFTIELYEGATLRPSDPRGFRAWYERHVGRWEPERPGACMNGLLRTTGRQIRMRPRSTYINVHSELSLADCAETVHFVERCAHALLSAA